jgi:1-acyl-sn-glycerol-3-phosphate acyltransferase
MAERKGVEKAARVLQQAWAKAPSPWQLAAKAEFPLRAPTVPLTVEPPKPEQKLLAGYDSAWARKLPARYARFFLTEGMLRPVIAGLAQPERRGLDRLADLEGAAIFAANHHSHLDAGLLITSLPEPHRHQVFAGAAADYFFDTRVKATASALVLNAIPIERTKVGRRSAEQAAELLDEGWSMVIFPEGGRSPDGWGHPFRGGAAYLAIRCGVPVVPVHLAGTGRVLPKGKNRPTPGRTVVTFGEPLVAAEGERSQGFSERIERAVAALADEATSDWYSARRRAAAGETPSLAGPQAGAWRRTWELTAHRTRPVTAAKRWPEL